MIINNFVLLPYLWVFVNIPLLISRCWSSSFLSWKNIQKRCQRMRRKHQMRKIMRRNMERPCVVHVGRNMLKISSGFVATYVSSGFMGSVWRSLPPELNTWSSTSVLYATTREHDIDNTRNAGPSYHILMSCQIPLTVSCSMLSPCWLSTFVLSTFLRNPFYFDSVNCLGSELV